jgi:SAM-dependent methyltransferase
MTDRWVDYFERQGGLDSDWLATAITHWGFHKILYGMIRRHCSPPARILDVGCGPGWSDMYLASVGYSVTGIDNEPRLVQHARDVAARSFVPAVFERADAFDLDAFHGHFDLVYSCGVLEHFDREVTVELLREQAKCAPQVLIQIPTKYTALTGEITDERIYSMVELKEIVRDAGLVIEAAFGYGDITVTPMQIWLRRLLPRAIWRWLQNQGYAYSIAVLGVRR